MIDREKVIKEFEHLLNAAKGNYQDFVDLTVDGGEEILALLEKQEEQIKNRDESLEKAREEIKWLRGMLKEQEAVTIKKTKEHGFGVYGGICPKCRNWIQSAHSFCGFCGQEVKWE